MDIKKQFIKNIINAIGWRTNKKILLIESDDWGAVRMPDNDVYNRAIQIGLKVNYNNYDRFDTIEGENDLLALFDTLSSIRDINNNNPCITACTIMANPDFNRISNAGMQVYFYEDFTETYKKFYRCKGSLNLIFEGINRGVFYPQFHGREHINVTRYMTAINSNSIKEKFCFQNGAILGSNLDNDLHHSYFGALDYSATEEGEEIGIVIKDGLGLFESIFGFKSKSFVVPTNHQGKKVNSFFSENNVLFCQGGRQNVRMGNGRIKRIDYKWGDVDNNGITFWRRNCTFEPSRNQSYDWVGSCLKEIEIAFRWGKPAVINSHRVNYIGSLNEKNRTESLIKLTELLKRVRKIWKDVEFYNSAQLATLLDGSK